MAGRISIDNLSNSLKDIIEQNGLTEAQVIELIKNISGDISQLNTSNKSSLVAAINELFQSANNGKELIANAIGEPLSSSDTFSAMSNDINGLLSTFKTNMMNSGVTVESSDRFKQLIDKIANMAEEGSSKGIQYTEGIFGQNSLTKSQEFTLELNFVPSLFFIGPLSVNDHYDGTFVSNIYVSNLYQVDVNNPHYTGESGHIIFSINNLSQNGLLFNISNPGVWESSVVGDFKWYAIGVGEEDTTLRDSLASILQEEGVTVTEEDDMASLIGKVDSEFDRKNANSVDIISATTLPATGKENQICVITDNPNTILMTTDISDISSLSTNTIGCLIKEGKPSNVTEGGLLQITGNNLTYSIYMKYFIQNGSYIPSYIYKNVNWEEFTKRQINFIKDGYYVSPNPFGTFVTSFTSSNSKRYLKYNEGKGVVTYYNAVPGYYYMWNTLSNQINFEGYNTIKITAYAKQLSSWTANPMVKFYTTTVSGVASNSSKTPFTHPSYVDSVDFQSIPFHTPTDLYFDISSWTGEKYLAMMCYVEEDSSVTGNHIIITDISFM